eukprot:scaffold34916_cov170-Amphora_coffeaeformis.AAC.4
MNTAASIEARLRALEALLRESGSTSGASTDAPASRLRALETQLESLASTMDPSVQQQQVGGGISNSSLKQLWEESDKLMRELDPGSALTHQQQIAAPILYRRQQVLASAESLQQNMAAVMEILTLLSIGQPQIINNDNTPVSEMQVTKAPILTQTAPPSLEDQERLRKVENVLHETQQQVESIAARMDRLVGAYYRLVAAVSEKMVLADEAIASKST